MANNSLSEWHYSVYGLNLFSNRAIPALIPAADQESPTNLLRVNFCESERHSLPNTTNKKDIYASPGIAKNGEPFFQVWKSSDTLNHLTIRYTNGYGLVQFLLSRKGTDVNVTWDNEVPFDDILTYLLGPVLGCLLRLRGHTCLHAGVVAVGDKAIAIIGAKGAGKSTTTAALASYLNLPVLSDDIAVISKVDNQYLVHSGYPRLRLWPEAINGLPGLDSDSLPRILSISDKRYLELSIGKSSSQWSFHQHPLPLAAVYLLELADNTDRFSLNPLTGGESLFALAANVYPEYTLETEMRMDDFKFFGQLASRTQVRKMSRPKNFNLLASICHAIVEDAYRVSDGAFNQ